MIAALLVILAYHLLAAIALIVSSRLGVVTVRVARPARPKTTEAPK